MNERAIVGCLLGTAAGSLVHFLRYYLPAARLAAVDIDAELVEKMLQMRILPPPGDGLSYIYADARSFLSSALDSANRLMGRDKDLDRILLVLGRTPTMELASHELYATAEILRGSLQSLR